MSSNVHLPTDSLHLMEHIIETFPQVCQIGNLDESVQTLLEWLGAECLAERAYIFEINYDESTCSNTYEWCADGITPQKELLSNEPLAVVQSWLDLFKDNKPTVISNVEDIKESDPITYATLKPQNITSLIAAPLYDKKQIIGFVGVDNPNFDMMTSIIPLLFLLGNIFSITISNRDLNYSLDYSTYHDKLTKALNRDALRRDLAEAEGCESVGILVCDVSGMNTINETLGCKVGDDVIIKWYKLIAETFYQFPIYRINGDEFVVVCLNVSKQEFSEMAVNFEGIVRKNDGLLVVGSSFDDDLSVDLPCLVAKAEYAMQYNKQKRRMHTSKPEFQIDDSHNAEGGEFKFDNLENKLMNAYMDKNYFSFDTFFKSMSMADHHPYFGDLESNLWYLSDSMCELVGIDSNIVSDFIEIWEHHIPYSEDRELFQNDMNSIMTLKKEVHDLVYRIRDKDNHEFWIRCFGLFKWNEDKSKPLFFCGNVTKLNYAFVVDPVTNFPREKSAIRDIAKLQSSGKEVGYICFRLNGFGEINELRGRHVANNLLKDITAKISGYFGHHIQFYRLDGLRFLGIIAGDYSETAETIAEIIETFIRSVYIEYSLPIRFPSVIGILDDYRDAMSAQEVLTDIMSLLEIAKNTRDKSIVYSTHTIKLHRDQKQMLMVLSRDASTDLNNFRTVIQPIVSLKTHKIVGGELLLRWRYNNRDVSPMLFIPALEESKLILPVGRWVFDQAARHCKRIQTYCPDFFMDFNISYYQITDNQLIPHMQKSMQKWGVEAEHMVFELTETHYNDNPLKLQEFIDDCKKMGMKMALDDFGVGYSSLEMLLRYPANVVKLDRSLMKKMSDSREVSDFITSIVYACHRFGKLVCVEGVETQKELEIVTEAGCDMVQGYYFYKPMEANDVFELMSKQKD